MRFAETQEAAHLTGVHREDAEAIHSVTFSPDTKSIVGGNGNGTLQLWNWQNNSIDVSFQGHDEEPVRSVVFSPDGQFIISGSSGNSKVVGSTGQSD